MNTPDPASLQNLNNIVLPVQVGWWPLATGWYFLLAIFLIALAWLSYGLVQRWFSNRYRRAALQELHLLAQVVQNPEQLDTGLRQIPILLKRTALSAYPRQQVASLSGKEWHDFLNSTLRSPIFTASMTSILDKVSYSTSELESIDPGAITELLDVSKYWLKHHQPNAGSTESREA